MNKYIGCKIIKAEEMTFGEYLSHKYESPYLDSAIPDDAPGYMVIYPGIGWRKVYISWSPKEIFEIAYRQIENEELKLLKD